MSVRVILDLSAVLVRISLVVFFTSTAFANGTSTQSIDFKKMMKEVFNVDPSAYQKSLATRQKLFSKNDALTMDEKSAIYGYTATLYRDVNPALRNGGKDADKYKKFTKVLDQALEKIPPYEGFVSRAVRLPASVVAGYKKGAIVSDDGYTSTTQFSANDDAHYLNIRSKTGRPIGLYSAIPMEGEILFRPKTQFKVIEVTKKEDAGITIFDLEEI